MKVTLTPIVIEELKNLINIGFKGDAELLETFHISPGTLKHCVDHTYNSLIKDYYDDVYKNDVRLYRVDLEEAGVTVPIGYTTIVLNDGPHCLHSYAISIAYRKAEILKAWLDEIEKITSYPYFAGLWNCNVRAMNFFKKNGFVIEAKNDFKLLIKHGPQT